MASRYQAIDKNQMIGTLESCGLYLENPHDSNREMQFVLKWNDDNYMLRVYTSIQSNEQQARPRGQDAIRVVCFIRAGESYQPIWRGPRVYRTVNWKDALLDRLASALHVGCYGKNYTCENCGSLMVGREGKAGFFYGCSAFHSTGCRYTRGTNHA